VPGLLDHVVSVDGAQLEAVDPPELANPLEPLGPKRRLALERVEYDAFDDVPQLDLVVLGDCLQHLQNVLLDADSGLNALHDPG
jgi:hypothetical protein